MSKGRKIIIVSAGRLKRENNTICFINDKEKKYLPIENLEEMYVFGRVDFNIDFFEYIGEKGLVVHIFDYYGWYKGSFIPKEHMFSGELIIHQVQAAINQNYSLRLAREFVRGAIYNLARISYKRDLELKNKLKEYYYKLDSAKNNEELMGFEGNARKVFYDSMKSWIDWEFDGRNRNPPKDPTNALISFLNSLTYALTIKHIMRSALHPGISFLHANTERNRFSLALDISEVFKPIFSEALTISLIKNKKLNPELHFDFDSDSNGVYLNQNGRNIVMKEWVSMLENTIMHRALKRKVSFDKLVELEIYKLIKDLLKDKKYKSLRIWW
ncbi:MAG: type I-B CRISPR-associated endonuclease Cas1b [Candidatus Anstonellales archaeon]